MPVDHVVQKATRQFRCRTIDSGLCISRSSLAFCRSKRGDDLEISLPCLMWRDKSGKQKVSNPKKQATQAGGKTNRISAPARSDGLRTVGPWDLVGFGRRGVEVREADMELLVAFFVPLPSLNPFGVPHHEGRREAHQNFRMQGKREKRPSCSTRATLQSTSAGRTVISKLSMVRNQVAAAGFS
jgi:hypothetical protein